MGSREGAQTYPCWGHRAPFRNPSFRGRNLPCGGRELGTLVRVPWREGSLDRKGGPRCSNGWREVCPTSGQPPAKCMLRSADFCCPGSIPFFFLDAASLVSFGELSNRMTRVGLALAPWFQGWPATQLHQSEHHTPECQPGQSEHHTPSAWPIRTPYPVSLGWGGWHSKLLSHARLKKHVSVRIGQVKLR